MWQESSCQNVSCQQTVKIVRTGSLSVLSSKCVISNVSAVSDVSATMTTATCTLNLTIFFLGICYNSCHTDDVNTLHLFLKRCFIEHGHGSFNSISSSCICHSWWIRSFVCLGPKVQHMLLKLPCVSAEVVRGDSTQSDSSGYADEEISSSNQ